MVSPRYSTWWKGRGRFSKECRRQGREKNADLDDGGALTVDDLERPVDHVLLDVGVVEPATDETLRVEDGLAGVHGGLVPARQEKRA